MSQPLTRPIGLAPGAVRGTQTTQVAAAPAGHVVTTVFSNLLALALVLLAVNVFDVLEQNQSAILIPVAIFACCLLAAFKLIRRVPITMLTTYPWVLLVIGFFHGLGSLAPSLASRETVTYLSSSFSITPDRLMRTNTLNLVGLASLCMGVLVGNALGGASRSTSRGNVFKQIDPTAAAKMAKVALAIGLPVLFLLRLPAQFGWLPFVVPGSVQQLASFVHVALIILAYLAEKKYPGARLSLGILGSPGAVGGDHHVQ